jgi:hypothetical protein
LESFWKLFSVRKLCTLFVYSGAPDDGHIEPETCRAKFG